MRSRAFGIPNFWAPGGVVLIAKRVYHSFRYFMTERSRIKPVGIFNRNIASRMLTNT